MSWLGYWVLITGLPAVYMAMIYGSDANFKVGFIKRLGVFIGTFFLFGIFTAIGLRILFYIFEIGKGATNWWTSLPDAKGSSSNDAEVPPSFYFIPMFMMLGIIIRGIGKL